MGALQPGQTIGRYRVLRALGAGAMGEVYLAEDPQIGRRVAVKTVRLEDGRAQELEERKLRLLREARAAGRLLHPNIVTLFDAGEDQGFLYLAFEYVEGTDLAHRMKEGPRLSVSETLSILRQAAEALDYAHRQGVIHRDIKPSNLLLTADGRVKIADFGIARLTDQTTDLTMTGSVVGSPHYLSPEQIRGEPLDGRTDVFSLGVMLYEMLAHRRPFDGETLTTLVYQILHKEPALPDLGQLQVGSRIQELLRRMLQKNREERFSTAGEVAREVARLERELEGFRAVSGASPQMLGQREQPVSGVPDSSPAGSSDSRDSGAVARSADFTPGVATRSGPSAPVAPIPQKRTPVALWVGLGVAVVLLGGGGAAYLGWRWYQTWKGGAPAFELPALPSQAPTPVPLPTSTPSPELEVQPLEQPVVLPPVVTPAPHRAPSSAPKPEPTPSPAPDGIAADRGSGQTPGKPVSPPSIPSPEPTRSLPAPTASPTLPEPAPEVPVEQERKPPRQAEEEVPNFEDLVFDRQIEAGMALAFDVQPDNAIVRINRIVLGQAREWNPKKKGRVYDLPRPGRYVVRILGEGRSHLVLVDARPGRPSPTWISVDLEGGPRKRRRH